MCLNRIPIFDRAVEFAAHVATGLLHFEEDAIQFGLDLFWSEHDENYIRAAWVIWGMISARKKRGSYRN